jgi:hypothetical protein
MFSLETLKPMKHGLPLDVLPFGFQGVPFKANAVEHVSA